MISFDITAPDGQHIHCDRNNNSDLFSLAIGGYGLFGFIDSIQLKDALTAVKVAMELNEVQDKTIGKIVELVGSMDQNMKLLATKVLELEKKLEVYERSQN